MSPGGALIQLPEAPEWETYWRRANPEKKKPSKTVRREQDADVAFLGALADLVEGFDEALEILEYATLAAGQRASAEVFCCGFEERIAAIRARTEPDDLDEEHRKLLEAEAS